MIPQCPEFISGIKDLGESLATARPLSMISGLLVLRGNYVVQ